jgi:uncharacterized protein YjiS (DUF1127 family)
MTLGLVDLPFIPNFIRSRINFFKKRSLVRQTYLELNKLSDKELNDIGISRSDIRAIAEEVFYDDRVA